MQRELVAQRPHHGELVEQPILRGELSPFPERPGELDLRAEKTHRLPKQLVFWHI